MLSKQTVYNGMVFDVEKQKYLLPNGQEVFRDIITHSGASAILPIDNDGKIVFVRQYRFTTDDFMLEIPAGCLDPGEDPAVCAGRELEEETGLIAGELRFILKSVSSIGISTEVIYLYIATNLSQGVQHCDPDEFVTIERYTPEEAFAMLADGCITDSKTIMALLYLKQKN